MQNEYEIQAMHNAKRQEIEDIVKEKCYVRRLRNIKKKRHLLRSFKKAEIQKLYIRKMHKQG